jgi:hypothetical protein
MNTQTQNYKVAKLPYTPISVIAKRLRVYPQRLSSAIKTMQLTVYRAGYAILLADEDIPQLSAKFKKKKRLQ